MKCCFIACLSSTLLKPDGILQLLTSLMVVIVLLSLSLGSEVPERFRRAVLSACIPDHTEGAADEAIERIRLEVARPSDSPEQAVLQMARCLPHIVPNVILAKREVRGEYGTGQTRGKGQSLARFP